MKLVRNKLVLKANSMERSVDCFRLLIAADNAPIRLAADDEWAGSSTASR